VRRLALLLVLTAGCRSAGPGVTTTTTGAPARGGAVGGDTPRAVVQRFLDAAQNEDLQALSSYWGDESGVTRDRFPRQELERRELIMICVLKHDKAEIGEPTRSENGRLVVQTAMTQGLRTADVKFTVAKGPGDRWFVQDFDFVALQNKGFCKKGA
jgi:hypothetical protein